MPVQVRWFTPIMEEWPSGPRRSFAKREGLASHPGSNPGSSAIRNHQRDHAGIAQSVERDVAIVEAAVSITAARTT